MAPNGTAHSSMAPGHFLFTSESVGEGHPGMLRASCSVPKMFIRVQIKFVTRSPMLLSVVFCLILLDD